MKNSTGDTADVSHSHTPLTWRWILITILTLMAFFASLCFYAGYLEKTFHKRELSNIDKNIAHLMQIMNEWEYGRKDHREAARELTLARKEIESQRKRIDSGFMISLKTKYSAVSIYMLLEELIESLKDTIAEQEYGLTAYEKRRHTTQIVGRIFKTLDHERTGFKNAGNNASVFSFPKNLSAKHKPAHSKHPDVILIVVDTLRSDRISTTAGTARSAPFIGKLAAEGSSFSNCRSSAPVTVTSMASILTGLPPYSHGLLKDTSWDSKSSLIRDFKDAGYSTIAVSGNPVISPESGFSDGFDMFRVLPWGKAETLNIEALRLVRKTRSSSSKPIFLYIHYIDPHTPYFTADEFKPPEDKTIFQRVAVGDPSFIDKMIMQGIDPAAAIIPKDKEFLARLYDKEVFYNDRMIRNLFEELGSLGEMENTIAAVTGDHGEAFFEHSDICHGHTLYEELIRVPLVIWDSKGKLHFGKNPQYPVNNAETVPALLELAGIKNGNRGKQSALKPRGSDFATCFLTNFGKDFRHGQQEMLLQGIVAGDLKLIENKTTKEYQMYDIGDDPKELTDLTKAGGRAVDIIKLKKTLAEWETDSKNVKGSRRKRKQNPKLNRKLKELKYIN